MTVLDGESLHQWNNAVFIFFLVQFVIFKACVVSFKSLHSDGFIYEKKIFKLFRNNWAIFTQSSEVVMNIVFVYS